MLGFSRATLAEMLVFGLIAGGLGVGIAALFRFGFDRNATLAFLGAIVGAATAVGLTMAQQDRSRRLAESQEASEVQMHFAAVRSAFQGFLGELHKPDLGDGAKQAQCSFIRDAAQQFDGYLSEALNYGTHFDFRSRAQLRVLQADVRRSIASAIAAYDHADRPGQRFDGTAVSRDLRNVLNGMELVRVSIDLALALRSR